MRFLQSCLLILVLFSCSYAAEKMSPELDKAVTLFQKADYPAALALLQPLADKGPAPW